RARGAGLADALGQLRVADGFAERDLGQLPPHLALESGALRIQRQLEAAPRAGEILAQLALGEVDDGVASRLPVGTDWNRMARRFEFDQAQAVVVRRQKQRTDRTVDLR